MRWHDERINACYDEITKISVAPAFDMLVQMRIMRDDYEAALIAQRAEAVKLAQRVAELEADNAARRHLSEIREQAMTALIKQHAEHCRENHDGRIYAEGCKP